MSQKKTTDTPPRWIVVFCLAVFACGYAIGFATAVIIFLKILGLHR